ncbi:MAG: DinB family protein, partial [Deltaproteobacteria bacterium]
MREHLLSLLAGENAHLNFDRAIAHFPFDLCGLKPEGIPYTAWQILEHLRIAQWDILEFSRNPKHTSPEWPMGYWPPSDSPSTESAWQGSLASFRADRKSMENLVKNPRTDLFARIPHGDGQTILREALLVADHNAYHI